MANIRIISDNAADRATLVASSTAGALAVAALQTDDKTDIWRSPGTTASVLLSFPALETISGIHKPFTNLTPAATLRVRGSAAPPAVNLLRYSEQINVAPWAAYKATIVPNARAAPDGTQTMSKLVINTAANTQHASYQNGPSLAAGVELTFSIFVAAAELGQVCLQMGPSAVPTGIEPGANFDLASGAVSLQVGGAVGRAVSVGNGIWRCSITGTNFADIETPLRCTAALAAATATGAGRSVFATGNGTSGIYLWGAQLEAGPAATTYSRTTDTPATYGTPQAWPLDTGPLLACPAPSPAAWGWNGANQGVNSFAYGGAVHARLWLQQEWTVRYLLIEIADPGNPQGYIESSRLVVGRHWSPENNADDSPMIPVDRSNPGRTEAGGRFSERGTLHREVSVSFPWLTEVDRAALWSILRTSGLSKPMLLSLFPNDASAAREQANQIYGALQSMPAMETPDSGSGRYACKLNLEEI